MDRERYLLILGFYYWFRARWMTSDVCVAWHPVASDESQTEISETLLWRSVCTTMWIEWNII